MDDVAPKRPYHALSVIPDIDQRIIRSIAAGKSLKKIAAEYGVDNVAVLRRARKHADYADALQASLQTRMEDREEGLEAAADNVSVTRADRLLGHARWLAERSCPDRWGAKQLGGGNVAVQIVIHKPDAAPQVIVNGQEMENADA